MKMLLVGDFHDNHVMLGFLASYGKVDFAKDALSAFVAFYSSLSKDAPYELVAVDMSMKDSDFQRTIAAIRSLEAEDGMPLESQVKIVGVMTDADCPRYQPSSFTKFEMAIEWPNAMADFESLLRSLSEENCTSLHNSGTFRP